MAETTKIPSDLVEVGPGGYITLQEQKTEEKAAPQATPTDLVSVDPEYVEKQVDLLNPVTKAAAVGAAARPLIKKTFGMDEQAGRGSLETYLKSQIHHQYPGLNLAALEREIKKIHGPQAVIVTPHDVQEALKEVRGVYGTSQVDLSPYTKNITAQPTLTGKAAKLTETIGENINPITGQGFGAKTMRTAGRGVLGGAAGVQAASAWNRAQEGDMPGAATSAIGGLGAALLTSRNPKAKGLGAILQGVSLPGQFMREEKEEKATGGLVHLAKGGKAIKKLSEVLVPHEGKTLLGTMADRTKATEGFSGGPGFINLHPEYTWAVDAPGAATRHMNIIQAAGGPQRTVVAPMLMSPQAHKSNRPVFEKMYTQLLEDVKSGKVTPDQIAALNKRIAVEKSLGGAPDVTSKEFLDYANAFHRRGTIADIMGQKRIGAVDLQKHLEETMDPALRESKLGAIGPQLFTMESHMLKPDVHPGYKYLFTGEKGADQFTPVPREFLFRDLEAKSMKELGRPLSDYNYRTSVGIPSQLIDEKLLRELQEKGYAKGGRIAKAARDLILPPAENAARTQIIGTLPTYAKAAEILKQRGASGRGIDVGAGLGEGSKILGPNFDTMEPYAKNWKPTFTSAEQMPSDAYGQLTNLNVMNVMPREARDELVQNMGRTMEPGGLGILTTRGADVMKAQGRPGPEPMSIITSRDTYQKGFTKQELEDYLRYMLGDKFDVNKINLGPAGAIIQKKAEGGSTTPAWQRAEGKNPEGGLNAVGRASYNRETGGNLKAPQPEGGSRKKSFCARMGGMKKKLTSSKTANDPDSRINKALRKWKC